MLWTPSSIELTFYLRDFGGVYGSLGNANNHLCISKFFLSNKEGVKTLNDPWNPYVALIALLKFINLY